MSKKEIPFFSVVRVPGGWSFVKLNVDEKFRIINKETSEPDTKPIITEKFKIEVGKYWSKLDEQTIS